jgi:hypothetical protein
MKAICYFLCMTALTTALFSCKKNDDNTIAVAPVQTTLLSKAIYSSVGTYDYTYDAQNRLKTETYSGNASNPAAVVTFTGYDSDGKLTGYTGHYTVAGYTDYNTVITYSSSKPDKMFFYNVSGPLLYYIGFTYSGTLVTQKQYSTTGAVTSTTEYTYSADGKNVVQSKSYNSAGTLTSTTVYTNFDGKKTAEGLIPAGYSTIPANTNNWQTLSRTSSAGVVTGFSATYEYNADGYPTRRIADNGANIEYQYIKK